MWFGAIELICLPFSVDDALCQGHPVIQKLKMDPVHQAWQDQHRELGRHAFPHLGSCSIGCNFRSISLSLCWLNSEPHGPSERLICCFGHSICQTHPSLPFLLDPDVPFSFSLMPLCFLNDLNLSRSTPLEQKASQRTQLCH